MHWPQRWARPGGGDLLLRVLGGLLAFAGGCLVALLSLLLAPLRVADAGELVFGWAGLAGTRLGTARLPVAVLLAVAGNLVLVRFAGSVTGVRWGAILPAVGWFLVLILPVLVGSPEGDRLVLDNDWVAALTMFGGTIVLVIGVVLALTTPGGSPGVR